MAAIKASLRQAGSPMVDALEGKAPRLEKEGGIGSSGSDLAWDRAAARSTAFSEVLALLDEPGEERT